MNLNHEIYNCTLVNLDQSLETAIALIKSSQTKFIAFSNPSEINSTKRIQTQIQAFDNLEIDALSASFWLKSSQKPILLPQDHTSLAAEFLNRPQLLVPNWLWQREKLLKLLNNWQPLKRETWFYELFLKAILTCQLTALPQIASDFRSLAPPLFASHRDLLKHYFSKSQPIVMELLWATMSQYPTSNKEIYNHWKYLREQDNSSSNQQKIAAEKSLSPQGWIDTSSTSTSPWTDPCKIELITCLNEPTSSRFNTLGTLHSSNPTLRNLCLLASLNLQPNQPQIFPEISDFWQKYQGNWPNLKSRLSQPLVSVLVTTFNRPKILANAISSILQQTWQDLEVLVINDGGDPDAANTVAKFNDPRLRYFYIPNSGQAAAFNYGIQQAVGEYFAFLDDDDVFASEHIQTSLTAMSKLGVDLVYGRSRIVKGFYQSDGQFTPISQLETAGEPYTPRHALSYCIFANPGNVIVRRKLLQKAGLFNEALPWGREWDLWLRCCEFTKPYFSGHISGEYRRSSDNMTNQWYRGVFYECNLLGLFHRTARGSLILYTASLYNLDKVEQNYWREVWLQYPSALNAGRLAKVWQQLCLAPISPEPTVLKKLLNDNPLATVKLMQQGIIQPRQFVKFGGFQLWQSLLQSWRDLSIRFSSSSLRNRR